MERRVSSCSKVLTGGFPSKERLALFEEFKSVKAECKKLVGQKASGQPL